MSKQNWIEIYKFHVLCVTFVTIKLNSLFQYFSSFNTSCSCSKIFAIFPWNVWEHSPAFPGIFGNMTLYIGGHFPECLTTFPGIFSNIPLNIWGHSQEFLAPFPGIFEDISRNVWLHSSECLATYSRMFENIPRNVWGHSPEWTAFGMEWTCFCLSEVREYWLLIYSSNLSKSAYNFKHARGATIADCSSINCLLQTLVFLAKSGILSIVSRSKNSKLDIF